MGPGLGQGAHHQHDRHAPRLVHQPPAHLGRAYRCFHVRRMQPARPRPHPEQRNRRPFRARRRRSLAYFAGRIASARRHQMHALRRRYFPQRNRHSRRLVRLRRELVRRLRVGSRSQFGLQGIPKPGKRGGREATRGSIPRRRRPAPRMVPLVAADLGRAARARALLACSNRRLDARRTGPRHVEISWQRRRSCRHREPHGRRNCSPLGRVR